MIARVPKIQTSTINRNHAINLLASTFTIGHHMSCQITRKEDSSELVIGCLFHRFDRRLKFGSGVTVGSILAVEEAVLVASSRYFVF